uniref:Uncharacterized protein n=1 Tax=Brassica oleracea var. oleracea TaxID=109376 RepID=A0A0D3CW46_BRAOL
MESSLGLKEVSINDSTSKDLDMVCCVYWFYTGDFYSGEWFNGQSYGFGVQTCADGSSYVRKFKFGLKDGLGSQSMIIPRNPYEHPQW